MSTVYEAWVVEKRPIFSRLPNRNGGYDNSTSDILTSFWDELLVETRDKILDISARQLNPGTCDVEWLDYLALLTGWDKNHWQKSWDESSKRKLLSRSLDFIWENKGSIDVLRYVLNSLDLKNRVLEQGSFIIGSNTVGDEIGVQPWNFKVILPTAYMTRNEFKLVQFIVKRFSPAWCVCEYVFDDTPFREIELIEVLQQTVLEDGLNRAIEIEIQ